MKATLPFERGYLLKGSRRAETLRAIVAVANGEALFSASIARRMMGFFHAAQPQSASAFPELTEREREVLTLIAHGRSNSDIASELTVTMKTVRNHVSNVWGNYRSPIAPKQRSGPGKQACSAQQPLAE